MIPACPDHTIVECDWLYLPEVVQSGKDVSGVLVPSEHHIADFHRWVLDSLGHFG